MKVCDVIKWENMGDTFIYKFPEEDFNTMSQLIVNESQEAIFFNGGEALDTFGAGRHTLKTQNLPILTKLMTLATDGVSPFHCQIYYINKTEQMAIKWGTDSQIQYTDPEYGFPLSIGVSGEMALKVSNGKKLLMKLVGTANEFNKDNLTTTFRAFLMSKVKPYIARFMVNNKISIFDVDAHIDEFSEDLKKSLDSDFDDYGLELVRFFVTNVVKPESDAQYNKFKELHFRSFADIKEATLEKQVTKIKAEAAADKMVIESAAMAQKRAQEGYTYQQEKSYDVAKEMAKNEATGQYTNMGVGIGMMAGVGGTMAGVMGNALNSAVGGATPPPLPNAVYHIALAGGQTQQQDINTIKNGIANGMITKETLLWKAGMANWAKAAEIPEIMSLFGNNGMTPPPIPTGN